MPAPVIAAIILAAGTTSAAAIASSGNKSAAKTGADASGKAAALETDAANHAADLQSKSAADTLAFQRQQAETDYQNNQQTSKANYDQWAAREGRLSSLGQMVGLSPRNIPGFSPGIDPGFNNTAPSGAAAPGGAPAAAAGGDPLLAQIAKWSTMPGADPSLANDPNYWVRAINGKGGLTPSNLQYWQNASVGPNAFFRNPGREGGGTATTKSPLSIANMAYRSPVSAAPILAPGVSGLNAQQPFSFADMVR